MKKAIFLLSILLVSLLGCAEQPAEVSFQTQVMPLLKQYCVECHLSDGEGFAASEFLVDSYVSVMKGTRYGPVIEPGSAISSTLYRMIAGKTDPSIKMPHGSSECECELSETELETIKNWIDQGAKNN